MMASTTSWPRILDSENVAPNWRAKDPFSLEDGSRSALKCTQMCGPSRSALSKLRSTESTLWPGKSFPTPSENVAARPPLPGVRSSSRAPFSLNPAAGSEIPSRSLIPSCTSNAKCSVLPRCGVASTPGHQCDWLSLTSGAWWRSEPIASSTLGRFVPAGMPCSFTGRLIRTAISIRSPFAYKPSVPGSDITATYDSSTFGAACGTCASGDAAPARPVVPTARTCARISQVLTRLPIV